MSSLAFLVTELQSLASETRRKHPEVREAAEKSLAILRASPEQATANLARDGPQSDDLLRPVFMGCATKNAKVVAIALGSLQRLISLRAVPTSAVPVIVQTMSECMSQGVDIQLRILQTLLSLITNFPSVHGQLLGDALLLCFKLQESRIAVVSSTAAATLRQLVMFVVDKVVDEDRREASDPRSDTALPDGTMMLLGPSAGDAYAIFEDLCLLANAEKPHFLKLEFLHKTFALELIESVLTNYHDLFRKHRELMLLVQHHLCPLLLKALSDRPMFPLSLRATRVVFLLLKQFSAELLTEAEVFFMLLVRIIGGDGEAAGAHHGTGPLWMRVLAMEILRGLCADGELMRSVWERYDAQSTGSRVFTSLVTALKRLVMERPALLGVGTQMMGVGVATGSDVALDNIGGVAGMMANAANAAVGMIASGPGLSLQGSAMKLQCIDQLDKADSPPIPEAYIYLLGVQCIVALSEGFVSFTAPLYTSVMVQKPRAAGDAVVRAPAALDLSVLPADLPAKASQGLVTTQAMVSAAWPALLAALTFAISTNLSDELFADVLGSFQALAHVAGMLALRTPRDAFLASLAKAAIPSGVVASVDSYIEPSTPRTAASFTEGLGLGGGGAHAPGLSERNVACLKVYVASAVFLAGSLDESWFDVLETLQNADYVLTYKSTKRAGGAAQSSATRSGEGGVPAARHPLLQDLDPESVQGALQRLFDASKNMEDAAFREFVGALCRLSAEMVGMQSGSSLEPGGDEPAASPNLSPAMGTVSLEPHRRRVSGIHLPRTLRSGDFGINKLGGVAQLNIHRLIYRAPEIAWDAIVGHLLAVLRHQSAPQSIRVQAARVLDDVLVTVPRNLSSTGELKATVQRRVLDALSRQVIPGVDMGVDSSNTGVELRKMGLETLHQILQASGHTLLVGWETIFEMLSSVCKPAPPARSSAFFSPASPAVSTLGTSKPKPPPLGYTNEKGYTALVKIAFQSLTLVCDSLSSLSPEHLRLCITTIGSFGQQADTNIALTAVGSLMWGVSDSIQAKRKDVEQEQEYSALWMLLLLEVLGLCTDGRPEVRIGAIQTLFRTLQLYGATLSLETWEECIWKITFPLLESMSADESAPVDQEWDDSKILALQSVGSIFGDFLTSKIMQLSSFVKLWDVFAGCVEKSVLLESRAISAPALRCLEKAIKASGAADSSLSANTAEIWQRAWQSCDVIGEQIVKQSATTPTSPSVDKAPVPFTQESLVALVDVISATRSVSKTLEDNEWPLERLTRLMAILKGVLTYTQSPDYRPDIDGLTPVQSVVLGAVTSIDLNQSGVPSLVLRDLSEYTTLPFLAAFDVPDPSPAPAATSTPTKAGARKRITYIGLCKKTMPMLVELFAQFKGAGSIYVDGTVEAILGAYAIAIKLKYDCPPASKFGKDPPLWKTATTNFLSVVKDCVVHMKALSDDIPDDRLEGIWRQIIDVFRGGILSDCSAAEAFPLEKQIEEENFDLALIAALEIDVIPHLGDPKVPDSLITHLARTLQEGSRLQDFDVDHSPGSDRSDSQPSPDFQKETIFSDRDYDMGTTRPGTTVPRERFSYWCFDLLFLICSDTAQDQQESRRRVAALSVLPLLNRCRMALVSFVADEALRGNLPFPRVRQEELMYVLRKLLELRLWPGTFWAATSGSPSQHCVDLPPIDQTLSGSALIADAVKRSTKAHLFHLYPTLAEIVSTPRKMPIAWMASSTQGNGDVQEYDSRTLARDCLKVIGREMGIQT